MKKFVDKTNQNKENSVRKSDNFIQNDNTISLGYFSSQKLNPKDSLVITDISTLVQENNNINSIGQGSGQGAKIYYSNEIGILEDENGNSLFSSDDLSVSDLFLSKQTLDKRTTLTEVEANDFVHSYYISSHYTLLNKILYTFNSLNDYISEDRIPSSIKVIDENGEEYIDKQTRKKKYRILLDPINTSSVERNNLKPYSIIVLLQDPMPKGLYLVYDKVEIATSTVVSSVAYGHKENINPIKLFSPTTEESAVIDPTSRNAKKYSAKALSTKSNYVNNSNSSNEGYEIFVPKKAISDNRAYETFNWRLIAKVNNRTNVSAINYGEAVDEESNIRQKTINCAVLWTTPEQITATASGNTGYANPYIFNRLQNSPFNLSQYIYTNPKADSSLNKNQALYWLVDIDQLSSLDDYDIVAWSPTSSISAANAQKIKSFVEKKNGTVILDLSSPTLNSDAANTVYPYLNLSSSEISLSNWQYNTSNIFIDESQNNAWPISDNIFEAVNDQVYYGIFGNSFNSLSNQRKKVRYFDSASITQSNIVLKETTNGSTNPIFISSEYRPEANSLVRGTILATTTPIMKYCNDVYQSSSIFNQALSNSGLNQVDVGTILPTAAIEGPFKILYNAICVSAISKMYSTKTINVTGPTYYVVGNWNSSYVLNGNVLLDDEKSSYSLIPDSNKSNQNFYSRNLTSNYGSALDYYKRICYDFLPDQYSILTQDIDMTNVSFYIEVTNKNIELNNLTKIENNFLTGNVNDIPSSHSLYQMVPSQYNANVFAYTTSASFPFQIPGGFGSYVLKEKNILKTNEIDGDNISKLITTNTYKSYPFAFSTYSSYSQSKEATLSYDVTWSANVTATGTATLNRYKVIKGSEASVVTKDVSPIKGYSSVDVDDNAIIRAIKDPMARISSPKNNFFYSGDINITKYSGQYSLSKEDKQTGNYVKYIQYTLANSGIESIKKIAIDGIFGKQTDSMLKTFQSTKSAIYVDGVVDSETKSYLARVWKTLFNNNITKYNTITAKIEKDDPEVLKFIREAVSNPEIDELSTSDEPYRRISFSGSTKDGPKGIIQDTIYVRVPAQFNTKKTDYGISNVKVNSITITPGAFKGASKYKGLKIVKIVCAPEIDDDKLDGSKVRILKDAIDFTTSAQTFDVSNVSSDQAIWFAVKVEGGPLGGIYGTLAEGYSLQDISFNITYTQGVNQANTLSETPETKQVPFTVTYTIQGETKGVDVNSPKLVDLSGINTTKYTVTPVSMTYPTFYEDSRTESLSGKTIDFSLTDYKPPITSPSNDEYEQDSVTLNLATMQHVVQGTPQVVSAISNGTSVQSPSQYISVSYSNSKLNLSVSALSYSNLTAKTTETPVTNYWLLKQDNSVIKNSKNTVSVLDGLLLLCSNTETGSNQKAPVGINVPSISFSTSANEEINIDYGNFVVTNTIVNLSEGLLWGFYDNSKKEFLGRSLSYLDYINRGPANIYIGVMATDADGNTISNVDFIGPSNANLITPVSIPQKTAYPIYCVKYTNAAKIQLKEMNGNLNKFSQWPLMVSSGAFSVDWSILESYAWVSWVSKYKNETLRAFYSTIDLPTIPWSTFLGRPYIDVRQETPTILSKRSIKVAGAPIAYVNEPAYTGQGKITYFFDVYFRNNSSSSWYKVDKANISSVDAINGVINFTSPIVPNEETNIYVDYKSKLNGIPLKHINGNKIPLNPFLNKDIVEYDKVLYIYLKPTRLQHMIVSTNGGDFVDIPEYICDSPIDFTYDPSIFNPYISTAYNPFAIPIATISYVNHFFAEQVNFNDLRIRGGGVKSSDTISEGNYSSISTATMLQSVPESSSFWDVYPPLQQAYPKGGFVIIKMPSNVKNNFQDPNEIYSIIERNMTAGVAYVLQDMNGNDWGIE